MRPVAVGQSWTDRRTRLALSLPLAWIGPGMAAGTVLMAFAGLLVALARMEYRFDRVYGLYALFDLGSDSSVPTWYASITLLICSGLLWCHARLSRQQADGLRLAWAGLALIFWVLSIDEVARLHELLGGFVGAQVEPWLGEGAGFFHYRWVFAGAGFTALVAVVYIPFLRALPLCARVGVLLSGVIYVSGALVVEMFNAREAYVYSTQSWGYQIGTLIEESLEMSGVALFAHVLVAHLGARTSQVTVNFMPPPTTTPRFDKADPDPSNAASGPRTSAETETVAPAPKAADARGRRKT